MSRSRLHGGLARIWRRLRGTEQSPRRIASAVALGLFIGCLPLYGLHLVLLSVICLPLGLDLVLAYLVANISNPLIAPFLITLEVEVGSLLLTGHNAGFSLAQAKQTGVLGFVWQAGVGSVFVGGVLAALGGGSAYFIAGKRSTGESVGGASEEAVLESAVRRTILRYAGLSRADRFQVAGKLRFDPLTKMLASLPPDLGRVLDAGAGRGQFGLLLYELSACRSLSGLDSDGRKVSAAQAAAGSAAHFEVRDLLDLPSESFDTLLLFDVLHYLPIAEQDELLRRASASRACRRLLIRELDAAPSARSSVTRIGESLAQVFGVHRGRAQRHYRPAAEISALLTDLGFRCQVQGASEGTPFGNVLIVAERNADTVERSSSGTS